MLFVCIFCKLNNVTRQLYWFFKNVFFSVRHTWDNWKMQLKRLLYGHVVSVPELDQLEHFDTNTWRHLNSNSNSTHFGFKGIMCNCWILFLGRQISTLWVSWVVRYWPTYEPKVSVFNDPGIRLTILHIAPLMYLTDKHVLHSFLKQFHRDKKENVYGKLLKKKCIVTYTPLI